MTQALVWLDLANVRDYPEGTTRAQELRRIVDVYRYCDVSASWEGSRYDRPGVFYVLEGDPHRIVGTVARLASGLYFAAYVVPDLNDGTRTASPSYGIAEEATP